MERSIRALHHRQTCIQGNGRRGSGSICSRRNPRLHHLNFKNSPLFPHDKGFGEAGNKNPSGAVSSGGVRNVEHFEMGSAHLTSTRKRARINLAATQWVERCQRWLDECELADHRSFSFLRARLPRARGRVYDRGSWRRQGEKRDVANFALEVMCAAPTFAGIAFNRKRYVWAMEIL